MNAGRSRTSRRIRRRSIPIGSARPPSSSRSSVEAAKESIHFVRAFVQDELSKAINPLGNEINRLKREIAELATAKPQPAGSVLDITKETLTSFERRLSRHAEHLSRLEDRMKRLETKRAR